MLLWYSELKTHYVLPRTRPPGGLRASSNGQQICNKTSTQHRNCQSIKGFSFDENSSHGLSEPIGKSINLTQIRAVKSILNERRCQGSKRKIYLFTLTRCAQVRF